MLSLLAFAAVLTGKNDSLDVAELDDRVKDSGIRLLVSVDG
jgi:hypothetical protein